MEQPITPGTANRLRRGDANAIEILVDALHIPVYRYLLSRCSTAPHAEELTAETFFQVLKSISTFRGDDHQIRAFVFSTARHVQANSYRTRLRETSTTDDTTTVVDWRESPLERLLSEERSDGVSKAIAKLTETAREIVLLRFVEGLSINEIATVCNMPSGTVKSHLYRAKQELKNELSDSELLK